MKVLFATPCMDTKVWADYVGSLLNTLVWCANNKIHAEVFFLKGSSDIGGARNTCASEALKRGFDKLMFIDADQAWTVEDFERLIRSKRTLVGGTYPKKQIPSGLNFNPTDEHALKYPQVQQPDVFNEYARKEADPETGEVEVKHLPTGFMCIDTQVLRDLIPGCPKYTSPDIPGEPDFTHYELFPMGVLNGRRETEDFFFCSIAREAGHPAYLNTRVVVDHIGQYTYRMPAVHRVENVT